MPVYRVPELVQRSAGGSSAARTPVISDSLHCLLLADATLRRGTRFLGGGLSASHAGKGIPPHGGRARVIGNALRELDRFLSLLIDAAALHLDVAARDRATLAAAHNTARKLGLIRHHLRLGHPDDAALRSIGRMRACLFHTAGIVRAGNPRSTPTAGWGDPGRALPTPAPMRLAIGLRIDVTTTDLARICHFYDRIADDLLRAMEINDASD